MKLSTVLLPTGEFALVLSEVPEAFPLNIDGLRSFKKAIGAAGLFSSTESVEVENALVDENARRATPEAAEFTRIFAPRVQTPEGNTMSLEFTLQPTGFENFETLFGAGATPTPGDLELTQQILAGADFSPAGLVKRDEVTELTPELREAIAKPVQRDFEGRVIHPEEVDAAAIQEVDAEEPHTETQTVTGANLDRHSIPGEFGRSPYTGPQEYEIPLESLVVSQDEAAWIPEVGQRVKVVGVSGAGNGNWINYPGRVVQVVPRDVHQGGEASVELEGVWRPRWFPFESLEPVEEPWHPEPGDRVRATGLSHYGYNNVGLAGTVVVPNVNRPPEGTVLVKFDDPSRDRRYYAPENLESLDA